MKRWKIYLASTGIMGVVAFFYSDCSQMAPNSSSSVTAAQAAPLNITGSEAYAVPITMNSEFPNIPTVSVTICVPGTSNCQRVDNVLLDTGSTGLRLYASAFSISLPVLNSNGKAYTECYQFGSASAYYGPVVTADVTLGSETATNVNLQVIASSSYPNADAPSDCTDVDGTTFTLGTSPQSDGYNGIIGVMPFTYDCGDDCQPDSSAAIYYQCTSGTSCKDLTSDMPTNMQVPNPIAKMPIDNNGFAVQVSGVGYNGATTLSQAYLVMGIGTSSDNVPPGGVTTVPVDEYDSFTTVFNGQTMSYSFLDTGSYAMTFPAASDTSLPTWTDSYGDVWFSPSSVQGLSATITSNVGSSNQLNLPFYIGNGETFFTDSPNFIFNDLGGDSGELLSGDGSQVTDVTFDWGFPAFLGRTIYFGFDSTSSSLGSGAFFAM